MREGSAAVLALVRDFANLVPIRWDIFQSVRPKLICGTNDNAWARNDEDLPQTPPISYFDSFMGSGPERGQSPVKWGEIPYVH